MGELKSESLKGTCIFTQWCMLIKPEGCSSIRETYFQLCLVAQFILNLSRTHLKRVSEIDVTWPSSRSVATRGTKLKEKMLNKVGFF